MTLTAKGLAPLTRVDASLAGEDLDAYYASLSAAVTAIGATVTTLRVSKPLFIDGATVTIPATLTLEFVGNGSLNLTTGQTVTILSDTSNYPIKKIFFNALAGQGTISMLGNRSVPFLATEWWGGKADNSTDNTTSLQAILDMLHADDMSGTVMCQEGIYKFSGALADTSFSNSQIVLPRRSAADGLIAVRFLGATPAPQAWPTTGGTIFKGTLTSGTGSMIGCKGNFGSGTTTQNEIAHNSMSYVSFQAENITFRQVANPTNSCVDLRFLPNIYLKDVRIDVDGISASMTSGVLPDLLCTEPTTSTSYGLLTPIDFIPNLAMLDNLLVMGYYNGIRWGELVCADKLTLACAKVGVEVRGATHPSNVGKLLIVSTAVPVKALGRDPIFTTSPNVNQLNIQQLDIEDSSPLMAWAATTAHISDASHYLLGDIYWFRGDVGTQSLTVTGGGNLRLHQIARAFNSRSPFTELTGGTVQFQTAGTDHAVDETYRGLATSDSSKLAWKVMTSDQSGTAHPVGILAYVNANIAGNVDKRLAQIAGLTDGATNSGALEFWTMNAGTLTRRAFFDKTGNFNLTGFMPRGEGATLASAATITPLFPVHIVSGTAAINTITVPTVPAGSSVVVTLYPTGAWTWTNAGNIAIAGTAVPGRAVIATWIGSISKWSMSY